MLCKISTFVAKFLFIIVAVGLCNILCQGQSFSANIDSVYYKNPEYFIARQVLDDKIVMLGDDAHHNFGTYGSVLKVLYALADEVVAKGVRGTKVTLTLEMGPEDAKMLNDYVTTDNPDRIINAASGLNYEDLEYYSNLKKFFIQINDINYAGKLQVKIEGFESYNFEEDLETIKRTPLQVDSAFLIRDSILSERIINFVSENPDSKMIIFYGNGHLQKGLSPKPTSKGESYGYFLADYLKRKFDNKRVVTFEQKWELPPEFFRETAIAEGEFTNIVVPIKSLDTAKLPKPFSFDYFVFWNNEQDKGLPHRFHLVFTRRNIENNIELLKSYKDYNDNQQVNVFNNSLLFYLNFITCHDFKNPDEAIMWDGSKDYDDIGVLLSNCFKNRIYEAYAHSKTKRLLMTLGFSSKDLEISQGLDTLKKFEEIWNEKLQSIIFMNEIGVMWIGYPDEQQKAKQYLIQYSDKDFENPEDYLEWYRNTSNR
jgi:hypothetical protein